MASRGGRKPPRRPTNRPTAQRTHDDGRDQELMQSIRTAMRSAEPLDLLLTIGGIVELTDPRHEGPMRDRDAPRLTLTALADSFIGVSYAETTAALYVIAALTTDEVLRARIDRELAQRSQPMPRWLVGLRDAQAHPDVWSLTHVLQDGDDYFVSATLTTGEQLTALIYIDHNMGQVVKDAFVMPEELSDVLIKVGSTIEDADHVLQRTNPADARARIEQAIEHGAMMHPPLESDDWPMCRPLVEWLVRMLPAGGAAPDWHEWTEDELDAARQEFLSSPFAVGLDDDQRQMVDTLLWFGTSYANADPYLWSGVTVELLLLDWFPRKVMAPVSYLAKMPDTVRTFIRYSHDRVGIREALTDEALASVDLFQPDYLRLISTDRPKGPAALAAALLDAESSGLDLLDDFGEEDFDVEQFMLERLGNAVGGKTRLMNLNAEPLPDEPFEWAGIDDDIKPRVTQILELIDRCADEILDVEHRTAMRRFLGRTAVADPAIFRRKASVERAAAAVAWVVCRANDTIGSSWSAGMYAQDLIGWFGLSGSVSQRAEPFLRANGVNPHTQFGAMDLGTPDLLVADKRAQLIETRDRYLDK